MGNPGRSLVQALMIWIVTFSGVPDGSSSETENVLQIHNPAQPNEGRQRLQTREVWRVGAQENDPVFGVIVQVLCDTGGTIYLLDKQLSTIWVYADDGRLLTILDQAGDGPGEFRRPDDMVLFPDGKLGVCKAHPGEFVCLTPQGVPCPTLNIGGPSASDGHLVSLLGARCRAGSLVALCQQIHPGDGSQETVCYLAQLGEDGQEICRYYQKILAEDFDHFRINESDNYFPRGRLWDIGPQGRIFIVPQRNAYRFEVYSPGGKLARVITRDHEPGRRDAREKAATRKGYEEWYGNLPFPCTIELEDIEPAITRLMVDGEGYIWVLSSRGIHDQQPGTIATYDVYSSAGHFERQVAIAGSGDGQSDDLFFLNHDRLLLVTDTYEATMALRGTPLNSELGEPKPMEIVCLEIIR